MGSMYWYKRTLNWGEQWCVCLSIIPVVNSSSVPKDVFLNPWHYLEDLLKQIHLEETAGDVLVFLTGQEEIESVERLLNERAALLPAESPKIVVRPIYSSLPSEQQMLVFEPPPTGTRKVWHLFSTCCAFVILPKNDGLVSISGHSLQVLWIIMEFELWNRSADRIMECVLRAPQGWAKWRSLSLTCRLCSMLLQILAGSTDLSYV